jgi:hypothetical protein
MVRPVTLRITEPDLLEAVLEVLPRKVSIARAIVVAVKKRASIEMEIP